MKKLFNRFLLCTLLLIYNTACRPPIEDLTIWESHSADDWESCYPLGNGHLGMMFSGCTGKERIVLNDICLWSGCEIDASLPGAKNYLTQIRKLILNDRNREAENLMQSNFVCSGVGTNDGNAASYPFGSYQMLGNLVLEYAASIEDTVSYRRELSLSNALGKVTNKTWMHEYFCSQAHDLGAIYLTATNDRPIRISLNRPERFTTTTTINGLKMTGQMESGISSKKGMKYSCQLMVRSDRDILRQEGDSVVICYGKNIEIYWTSATDYMCKDPEHYCDSVLNLADELSYAQIKSAHEKAYSQKFSRLSLNLSNKKNIFHNTHLLPTSRRLQNLAVDDDPGLFALFAQYGRYLLISSTREDLLPPNLQGLWCNTIQTPLNGYYNLNTQLPMNYWPVEKCNLSELNASLLHFTEELKKSGELTARNYYNSPGWVVHSVTNPFFFTEPGEQVSWGSSTTGTALLCAQLFSHFTYTKDTAYLNRIYPILKSASQFFLNNLVEDNKSQYLVLIPSSSPGNSFLLSSSIENSFLPSSSIENSFLPSSSLENSSLLQNGNTASICKGSTFDNQVIRELFTNTATAASELNLDVSFADSLRRTALRLPPNTVNSRMLLMEWMEDYAENDTKHSHLSHLYGLFPGKEITMDNQELMKAASLCLIKRGDEGPAWSKAWKAALWARLGNNRKAYDLLRSILVYNTQPNLLTSNPPFQINGNIGASAAIMEILLSDGGQYIELLHALPKSWEEGSLKGVCIPGAEMSITWKNGKLDKTTFYAKQPCRIECPIPDYVEVVNVKGGKYSQKDRVFVLELDKGETCRCSNLYYL